MIANNSSAVTTLAPNPRLALQSLRILDEEQEGEGFNKTKGFLGDHGGQDVDVLLVLTY